MNELYKSPDSEMGEENVTEYEYIGFWLRVVASIVDNIWMGVLMIALIVVFSSLGLMELDMETMNLEGMLLQVFVPFVLIMWLWRRYSSTPGKMMFKAKILDAKTYQPVSTGRLVVRYVGYFVSVIPFFLGFIWVAFDSKKQGFHDKLAGTVVVRGE